MLHLTLCVYATPPKILYQIFLLLEVALSLD